MEAMSNDELRRRVLAGDEEALDMLFANMLEEKNKEIRKLKYVWFMQNRCSTQYLQSVSHRLH